MAENAGVICFTIVILLVWHVSASTHWIVTEDGKIQEQVYSIFNMKRPFDLVALMQQEMRAEMAENFMDQLDGQITDIDNKRNKAINLQDKFYSTEVDCLLAEKPLTDYNLFVSTVATCQEIDNSLQELCRSLQPVQDVQEPNCTQLTPLDFSMHAFEHLQAMRERRNLTMLPDFGIVGLLPSVNDIPAFGHTINKALEKNRTSWVLYNFAGYYFRLIGDGYRAIECIRRALHFSPPELKHIALLNLGNVLHLSQRSDAAAVVVLAALDIDATNPVLHFTLGNIYAVLADYNKSIEAFNTVLQTNPDFEAAEQRKHAVLCHSKLEKALEVQYNSLKQTMSDLGNFEKRLDFWQKQQFKLLEEQAPLDVRFSSEMDYTEWKILQNIQEEAHVSDSGPKNSGNKIKDCSKLKKNGQTSLGCTNGQPVIANVKFHMDSSFNYLIKQAEIKTAMLKEEILAKQNERISILNKYIVQHESEKLVDVATETQISDPPTNECNQENTEQMLLSMPIFFFHNKDVGLGQILGEVTDDINDSTIPVCQADYSNIFENQWNWIFSNIKLDENLVTVARKGVEQHIADCCGTISDEAFGHRIAVAMKQDLAPKWLLYHVAAMYWGAVGNVKHLGECLMHSYAMSPPKYRHITVVPFASLLGSTGLHLAAINFLKFSIDVNEYEPKMIQLLADLYVLAADYEKALELYKRILTEDPENQNVVKRVTSISCHLQRLKSKLDVKQHQQNQQIDEQIFKIGGQEAPIWIDFDDEEIDGHCYSSTFDKDKQSSEDNAESTITETHNSQTVIRMQTSTSNLDEEPRENNFKLSANKESEAVTPIAEKKTAETIEEEVVIEDDPLPDILLQVLEQAKPIMSFSCKHLPPTDFKHFTSTWLSVSAKGIVVSKLFDSKEPAKEPPLQPFCTTHDTSSAMTLDHLAGIKYRSKLPYEAETGLREAFQTLGREGEDPDSVEAMGTRLAYALRKNSTSWVMTTLAALYWRVTGQAEQAIDCLRQALYHSPKDMRDIPLISLANVFHRSGLYNDALIVANMAMEISPGFVVIHFTLANIFAAKGNLRQARAFYETTLTLQPSFEPARDRLRAIYCSLASENEENILVSDNEL